MDDRTREEPGNPIEEGRVLHAEGRCRAALKPLAAFVDANPGHAEARCLMGRCLVALGHEARAGAWLARTLQLATDRVPVLVTMADLRLMARDQEGAAALLERAAGDAGWSRESVLASVAYGCRTPDAARVLARICEARGDAGRAADALELAAAVAPGDAGAQLALAVALAGLGRREEAIERCRRALATDPSNEEAKGLEAALAGTGAGPFDARRALRRANDLGPARREGRFNRLKRHVTLASFMAGEREAEGSVNVYVSAEEAEALDVDVRGRKVVLARCPRLLPCPDIGQSNIVPLAPIVLSQVLRARGAVTTVRDLHLPGEGSGLVGQGETVPGEEWEGFLRGRPTERIRAYVEAMAARIDAAGADLVGLSVETSGAAPLALCLARELGRRHQVPVVVGGRGLSLPIPMAGLCPEAMFVNGEGEVPLLLLLDALAGHRDLATVPGLVRVEGGQARGGHHVTHDLDVRPLFDLEGVSLDGYDNEERHADRTRVILEEGSGPLVPYQFNIGCPFFCGFCNSFSRREYRLRSPERIVADLADANRRFGVNRFYMVNHLLNCDMAHLRELVERLEAERLDIHWIDSCRAAGLDADLLGRLRRVGVSKLVWGVDCGSDRLACVMKKGVRSDQVVEILEASRDAGIVNVVNLILGMPHETEEDFRDTRRLVERCRPYVARFNLAPFRFFAESPMAMQPTEYGLALDEDGAIVGPDGTRWADGMTTAADFREMVAVLGGETEPEDPR
jgi:radical SAM superfamily enzyme YgiQ (UPF0313 family)/tetratricopeptide (TPR) repeat protein